MAVVWSFFFQAEDGIRGGHVTGVQTCALPIYVPNPAIPACKTAMGCAARGKAVKNFWKFSCNNALVLMRSSKFARSPEIGRASCRERVESSVSVGAVPVRLQASDVVRIGTSTV